MEIPKSMVEAGARGIYDAEPNYEDDPVAPWENAGESTRKRYKEQATACLRAAMVGVEVVFQTKKESVDVQVNVAVTITNKRWVNILPEVPLNDGDTLAVFRGGE